MDNNNRSDMPFLDHLEEFRWRLIKSFAAILVGAVITFSFVDQIIGILIQPTRNLSNQMNLQVLRVQGMFIIKWGLALMGGVVLAIPVLTYQMWKFVAPGLYTKERKYIFPLIFLTYISFLTGILFAYFVIIPISLNFFTAMGYGDIQNNFSINYYFSFMTWLMLGTGLVFELPIVSFILSSIGILTPSFMRRYRRHSIVVIMILSAIITPPDPISLLLMTVPLVLLYEISIGISWLAYRLKSQASETNMNKKITKQNFKTKSK